VVGAVNGSKTNKDSKKPYGVVEYKNIAPRKKITKKGTEDTIHNKNRTRYNLSEFFQKRQERKYAPDMIRSQDFGHTLSEAELSPQMNPLMLFNKPRLLSPQLGERKTVRDLSEQ
jgi:hypothetical protein